MQDTAPDDLRPMPARASFPPPMAPPRRPGMPYSLPIQFTGSGSEYFRIWIVNLLLTLVTLGIYFPWAKVRRLQYFHGNTLVGDEPMGFHGNPKKMLKGYVLVGIMFALYSVAGQFSPIAGLVALLIVMVVSPALFRASLQFRLANTSWRGLRFHFDGALRGAYIALLPFAFFAVIGVVAAVLVPMVQGGPGGKSAPSAWLLLLIPVILVGGMAAMVWVFWRLKKYQHQHYALASLQTGFSARFGAFVKLAFKLMGVGFLVSLALSPLLGATMALGRKTGDTPAEAVGLLLGLVPLATTLLAFVVLKPYFTSRLQNLVWSHTGNSELQFHSALRFKPLLWITVKNWFFIILTLGLYWPFAAIATARIRLQAVSVALRENPDDLVSRMQIAGGDAAGDAAGDLFGIDIGF